MALINFSPGFFSHLYQSKGLPMDVNVICYHKKIQLLSTTTTFICSIKSQALLHHRHVPERQSREELSMFLTPTEINQSKYIVYYCIIIAVSL